MNDDSLNTIEGDSNYLVTNLVSNNPDNNPQLLDYYASLGWGIAIRPAGLGGHFWINNSGTGTVTEYVGDVGGVPIYQDDLKVVDVTPTEFNPFELSGPTGQVFNGSSDFVVTQEHPNGDITAPSKFIFVASDGGISAWTERRNDDGTVDRPLVSEVVVDKFGDAIYYGAAITNFDSNNRLYAVDFGPTPDIEVFDANFTEITEDFDFTNPFADEGYAPYNIQNVNDSLLVAYAVPSPVVPGDEVIEPGLGRIAEFDLDGDLIATWDDEGLLNAPWGFVEAPDNFGKYSNMLLVSNFGDGTIVAFDPDTREAVDYLRDDAGEAIAIDGLWGLVFGNGGSLGETNDLYFAAGNDLGDNPGDGVFGKVEVTADVDVPAPGGDQTFDGSDGDDLLVISGDNNIFNLGDGNNTLTARGLNQTVAVGSGDDIISIGSGVVELGDGTNFVTSSAGSATVTGGSGDDTVNQVQGNLIANLGEGNNHATSGAGDDEITTGSGDDFAHAGAGTNTLNLGEGDNTVNTTVVQNAFLTSIGQTTVTTGSGSDTFQLGAGSGVVTITNFDESDRFELVGFKPDFSGVFSFSDVAIAQDDADTVISLAATEDVLAILQNTEASTINAGTFGEAVTEPVSSDLVVSFTTSTNSLNEAEGTPIAFNFTVTGDEFPEQGVIVRTDENFLTNAQVDFNINLFGVPGLEFVDFEEVSPGLITVDWRLNQPEVSIETTVFDDNFAEPDSSFTTGLLPIPGAGYTLDPDATTATIFVTDGVDGTGGPVVSLTVDPTDVREGEALTLTLTADGELPTDGLEVSVAGDVVGALGEFITVDETSGVPALTFEGLASFPAPNEDGSGFIVTMTDNTATISFSIFDDGPGEGPETFGFSVVDGENYDVNPDLGSVDITIDDSEPSSLPVVSFTITPDSLNEAEGTPVSINFKVTGDFPEEGVIVRTDENFFPNSQVDFNLDLFSIPGLEFVDFEEVTPGQFVVDWRLTLPEVSIETTVFDDTLAEPDGSFTTGLLPIPDANYTLDPDATTATVFVTDGVDGSGGPVVGLTVDPAEVNEGNELTVTLTANGEIPADGLAVFVDGDTLGALGDFISTDETGIPQVTFEGLSGFPTPNEDGSGFIVTMTDNTATISFNIFDDGPGEGAETFNFSLLDGEIYDVDASASSVAITINDLDTVGTDQPESLVGDSNNNAIDAGGGDDTVAGDLGDDILLGGNGDDVLRGDRNSRSTQDGEPGGNDIIFGGEGNDRIGGKAGNDILSGDAGDDFIWGDDGDDIIMGVTGNDTLVGDNFSDGSGSDLFVFGNGDGTDTILDFEVGIDRIGLVEGELVFAELTLTQDGANTLLGVGSSGEVLAVLNNIQALSLGESDFVTVPDVSNPAEALAII
ncbi:MAG: TIGR03118 family protein [Cyanobacteria bacterium P01_F01_bin.53]